MNELFSFLKSEYGILADSICKTRGVFSAKAAYRIAGTDGIEYFLKAYDKSLPTTRFYVERIDSYMPVLNRLSKSPALRGRILSPVKTQRGTFKAESDADAYVLFLYIHGEAPGVYGMTRAQTVELAETLALLHDISGSVPFNAPGLAEDITLPFCDKLTQFLDHAGTEHSGLDKLVLSYDGLLRAAVHKALDLRDTIRAGYSPLVLCHGDAHGNNVIQGERLVLVDPEDLRIAPAEADLFIHAWHPHGGVLLEAYAAARNGYHINHDLLYFYTLRRRIEDVWVDIERLTEEFPGEAKALRLLENTRRGIEEVEKVYVTRA